MVVLLCGVVKAEPEQQFCQGLLCWLFVLVPGYLWLPGSLASYVVLAVCAGPWPILLSD
jgi:hypothetical protein